MFNHGVITIGFFLLIGFIEQRRGSILIKDFRGLQGPAPIMAGLFTVVMLASIGLPGLSGFVSEYLILIGTFATHSWWAVVATFGVVAAAALPALGLPAGLPRRGRGPQRDDRRRHAQGTVGPGAGRRAHRRARSLPQARA